MSGSKNFSDVKPTDYYNNAVAWAAENGVSSGKGAGTFKPKDNCKLGLEAVEAVLSDGSLQLLQGFLGDGGIGAWALVLDMILDNLYQAYK